LIMVNDKSILGDRRNSLPANVITLGLSIVIVGLGVWMAYMTFTGQNG
jgi:Mn2+/Fe2+ NRAMP family transporter